MPATLLSHQALVLPLKMRWALLHFVRDVRWLRPRELAALSAPRSVREWTVAAYSPLIGGVSHVLLDAVTHGNHSGWLVPFLPWLRTTVPHIGGPVPLHDALQFWLTLVFGAASLGMWRIIVKERLLWRWRLRVVQPLPRMPLIAGHRLLGWCALAAVQGALVGWALHDGSSDKSLAAAVAFGMLDFSFVALLLAGLVVRRRPVLPL